MEDKEINNFSLVSLALEKKPLPEFKEKRGQKWVPYGTATNEFALELIDLVQSSELHGAIISKKSKIGADLFFLYPTWFYVLFYILSFYQFDHIYSLFLIRIRVHVVHRKKSLSLYYR